MDLVKRSEKKGVKAGEIVTGFGRSRRRVSGVVVEHSGDLNNRKRINL
jgi:hypothetical protein